MKQGLLDAPLSVEDNGISFVEVPGEFGTIGAIISSINMIFGGLLLESPSLKSLDVGINRCRSGLIYFHTPVDKYYITKQSKARLLTEKLDTSAMWPKHGFVDFHDTLGAISNSSQMN